MIKKNGDEQQNVVINKSFDEARVIHTAPPDV